MQRKSVGSGDGGKVIVNECLGSDRVGAVGVITYCGSISLCRYTCGGIAQAWAYTWEVVCPKIDSDKVVR